LKLLLFDIDGTLILTGGAGLRAMNAAFEQLYGVRDGLVNVQLAGRTDTSILKEALSANDIQFDSNQLEEYKEVYYRLLVDEMAKRGNNKCLMPGVRNLIDELKQRKDVHLGLLTGNWEKSGRIKLHHFGLDDCFPFGAFADDSEYRDRLLPYALNRFEQKYGKRPQPDQVYVIGDTPSDILCAKPHKARSVAVAAAHYSEEELAAYHPDILFKDLSDTDVVLKAIG
jgi:phosphoglycolate phosphatase